MNGNNGIVPTVDLATNNSYPVYPMMSGFGNGFGGFGGDGALWIIVILALLGGWGNNGGGFGFNGGFDNGFAWLSNGQKEIMQNTNTGFDTLHLSNQIEGVRDSLNGISSQICNSTYSLNDSIKDSFYGLNTSFLNCCCENRLGIADLKSTIISENCADRQALNEGVRDIIANQTAVGQSVLDKLCQLEIDSKNDKIVDLQREVLMKDLQASQVQQTADIVNSTYSRLATCPVGTTPVYGNQPIFTCPNNLGNSCGCLGTSQFI